MLVLSRKRNQGILIRGKEGDIRVVVLDAERGKLRLGIKAPGGYTIIREELVFETKDANRRSAMDGVEGMKALWGTRVSDIPLKGTVLGFEEYSEYACGISLTMHRLSAFSPVWKSVSLFSW